MPTPSSGQASAPPCSAPEDAAPSYTQDVRSDPLPPPHVDGSTPEDTHTTHESTSGSSDLYTHGNRSGDTAGADASTDASLSGSKKLSKHETLKADFERAHSEEMKSVLLVEGLAERVRQLRAQASTTFVGVGPSSEPL